MLAGQILERLAFMEDVAAYKFRNNKPVEDPEREEALLQTLVEDGEAFGLPPEITRRFFRAQMEAAKIVQRERIEVWTSGGEKPPTKVHDLATEVRPHLDRLSGEMLQTYGRVWRTIEEHPETTARYRTLFSVTLRRTGFSQAVAEAVASGLPGEP